MYICNKEKEMHTIQLKINDAVYEKFLLLLSKFNKDEIEVLAENSNFVSIQQYLQKELNDIVSEKAVFYTVPEVENKLDKIINNYENSL